MIVICGRNACSSRASTSAPSPQGWSCGTSGGAKFRGASAKNSSIGLIVLRMNVRLPSPNDGPSRIGRAMLFGAWVAGIALLAMLFQNYLDHKENPNRDLTVEAGPAGMPQVVLQQNRHGHYVATGTINGESVVFLLDTGATTVSLPLELARRLDLPMRPGGMSKTANGMVQTWTTRLDSVGLGGLTARNLRATVLPNFPGDQVLLGMDFLRRFELLQRGGELTIRLPS